MNKKGLSKIILTVVIVSIAIVAGYFVFTKQPSVTQIHQPEPPPSQDNSTLQGNLDNVATFVGTWEVVSVQEDGIQIVSEGSGATIEFFRDGTLKASGGCNEMMHGSYEIQANSKLSISIGGTKRMCAKDIVEFWDLNKAYRYKFTKNILFLHYKTEGGVEGFFKLTRLTSN